MKANITHLTFNAWAWRLTWWPSSHAACWAAFAPRPWTAAPAGRSRQSWPGRRLQDKTAGFTSCLRWGVQLGVVVDRGLCVLPDGSISNIQRRHPPPPRGALLSSTLSATYRPFPSGWIKTYRAPFGLYKQVGRFLLSTSCSLRFSPWNKAPLLILAVCHPSKNTHKPSEALLIK